MVTRFGDRERLPLGVLEDCRLLMAAEATARANDDTSRPTQDLLAGEEITIDG